MPRRTLVAAYCALVLLSAAELRIVERLLFRDSQEYGFVLDNLSGILEGRPAFPGFQHRLLGAACWGLLVQALGDRLVALQILTAFLLAAANVLAFELVRSASTALKTAFLGACGLGLAHLLLMYRLEYPWDGFDVLIFLMFGYVARRKRAWGWLGALCVAGVVNHETVLYIPLWYLLRAFDRDRTRSERAFSLRLAIIAFPLMLGSIWAIRTALYTGEPAWAVDAGRDATPLIGNPFHLVHNLRQLFVRNWGTDKVVISVAFFATLGLLTRWLQQPQWRTPALWTLCVLGSILCFGYVNETRLYLGPVAFWFGLMSSLAGESRVRDALL